MAWLSEIKAFNPGQLERVETVVRHQTYVVDHDPDLVVGTVDDGVLFGSQDVAADSCLLASLGVTHVLNLIPESTIPQFSAISYHLHPLLDLPETDLASQLKPILDWIAHALLVPSRKVYVHW